MEVIIKDKDGKEYRHELDRDGMRYLLTLSSSREERIKVFGSEETAAIAGRTVNGMLQSIHEVLKRELNLGAAT